MISSVDWSEKRPIRNNGSKEDDNKDKCDKEDTVSGNGGQGQDCKQGEQEVSRIIEWSWKRLQRSM